MGAYSTVRITRSRAKQAIVERMTNVDDNALAYQLQPILDPMVLNCTIVNDDEENDDGVLS